MNAQSSMNNFFFFFCFKTNCSENFRLVCRQMEFGVHSIFGPSDSMLGSHIQSICKALDVPHIETRFDFDQQQRDFSINLHPSQEHINNAYRDLIIFLNWTKVAIIYEEDYGKWFLMKFYVQVELLIGLAF